MPKVGTRSFAYNKKGKMAAKKYAKKTGQKAKVAPPMYGQIRGGGGGGKG